MQEPSETYVRVCVNMLVQIMTGGVKEYGVPGLHKKMKGHRSLFMTFCSYKQNEELKRLAKIKENAKVLFVGAGSLSLALWQCHECSM